MVFRNCPGLYKNTLVRSQDGSLVSFLNNLLAKNLRERSKTEHNFAKGIILSCSERLLLN